MTSAIENRSESRSLLVRGLLAAVLVAPIAACASFVEVPVETPLQSKLDVSAFRRVLIAGFVSDPGEADVDLSPETVRLLQNQLRSHTKMQILEPDRPPLQDALDKLRARFGDGERLSKSDRESFRLEAEKVLQDGEFWRRIGEEFQNPLIVTGTVLFAPKTSNSIVQRDQEVFDSFGRRRTVPTRTFMERKGFLLQPNNTLLHLNGPAAELGVTWAASKSRRGGVAPP